MLQKTYDKNVFEATFGDDLIKETRKGQLGMASPEAKQYFDEVQNGLRLAQLASHKLIVENSDEGDVIVIAKFHYSFIDHEIKHTIRISENGLWAPQFPPIPIDIAKHVKTKEICDFIAEKTIAISGRSYDKNGEPIQVEKIVLNQVLEILKPEIKNANSRLIKETVHVLKGISFRSAAQTAFENEMRDRFHSMLDDYQNLSPDAMHRFVDEFYCKKIHDA